ncbi:MAG: response regulator transcription factor [Magnetococcales bacterium]|nr:response regulator transcription factor [Magnetococcales bacterium]
MAEKARLLLIEDNPVSRKRLLSYLDSEVYEVETVGSLALAFEMFDWFEPELVLLDLRLPDGSGLSFAKHLTNRMDVGIIIVTSLDRELDVLQGLSLGADHYLTKPVNPEELNLKLNRLYQRVRLVRVNHPNGTSRFRFGDWVLNEENKTLTTSDGTLCPLTNNEFKLLHILVLHSGKTLSRDRILILSGRGEEDVFDRSVDITITRLRRKIEQDPTQPQLIQTVRGSGYLFNAGVEKI